MWLDSVNYQMWHSFDINFFGLFVFLFPSLWHQETAMSSKQPASPPVYLVYHTVKCFPRQDPLFPGEACLSCPQCCLPHRRVINDWDIWDFLQSFDDVGFFFEFDGLSPTVIDIYFHLNRCCIITESSSSSCQPSPVRKSLFIEFSQCDIRFVDFSNLSFRLELLFSFDGEW